MAVQPCCHVVQGLLVKLDRDAEAQVVGPCFARSPALWSAGCGMLPVLTGRCLLCREWQGSKGNSGTVAVLPGNLGFGAQGAWLRPAGSGKVQDHKRLC